MLSLGLRFSIPLTSSLLCFFFVASPSFGQSPAPSAPDITSVSGTVLNSKTQAPIAHALVVSPDSRFAAFTDGDGRFELKVNPAEPAAFSALSAEARKNVFVALSHALQARKPGFLAADPASLTDAADANPTNIKLYLTPESLIIGHVSLASPNAFDPIQVELYRRDLQNGLEHWNSVGTTTTRSDGEYRFAELQAGTYRVVSHGLLDRDPISFTPGSQLWGFRPVYFPSATDFESSPPIGLAAGSTFVADLSPSRGEYYNVKVKIGNASEGVPLTVEILPQGRQSPGYSLSYNSSQHLLQGSLPNGNYLIRVTNSSTQNGQDSRGLTGVLNLIIKGAPIENASIALLPNVSIPVTVREVFQYQEALRQSSVSIDSGDDPPTPRQDFLEVSLLPIQMIGPAQPATLRQSRNAGDDPLKIENVQPGTYRVVADSDIGYVASISSAGMDLTAQDLVIPFGGTISPIEIVVRDDGADVSGSIEGLPLSPESANASGSRQPIEYFAYFVPVRGTGAQFHVAEATSDGTFHLEQVPPGQYLVFAVNSEHISLQFAAEEMLARFEDKASLVTFVARQQTTVRVPLISLEP